LPSLSVTRARGTDTVNGPNVPSNWRFRWPLRCPAALGAAVIPASPQSRGKLFFKHVFNEAPDALANPSLQRIKPIRTQQWNLALDSDILGHGVISSGGANRRVLRCELGDYAFQISTTQAPRPHPRAEQTRTQFRAEQAGIGG
jgi:hypothetical protein